MEGKQSPQVILKIVLFAKEVGFGGKGGEKKRQMEEKQIKGSERKKEIARDREA